MKIPRRIKSQGLIWKIRFNDDLEPLGQTDYDKQEIVIRKSITPELKQAVFLHELFHTFNTTVNHELIDSLALQLFQVMKENNLWKK
jgi:hypothetical protein